MKSAILAAALFSSAALAWFPSCASSCISNWNGDSCTSSSGWDCVCSNTTAINSCVSSSCSTADQTSIFAAIDQLCVDAGAKPTASQEATFSATSGSWPSQLTSGGPWGTNSAAWSSFTSRVGTALPGAPSGWGGNGPWGGPGGAGGSGHGGPGGFGSAWSSNGGPISAGGCGPWSSWSGVWGPSSQWTGIWSGCSTSTASPSPATVTTTVNGQVVTGTTFGVQAVATTTGTASGNAAPMVTQMAAGGALMAALVGAVVAL